MIKLTKTQVIARIKKEGNVKVWLCPSKMYPHPNHPFNMAAECSFTKEDLLPKYPESKEIPDLTNFESVINSFSYYNCDSETGNRVHFYIEN
jgi:hypothetical protein